MAEGFANHYGSDVLRAESRGLSPTSAIAGDTVAAMLEKNIDVSLHVPRLYVPLEASKFAIVVNMSGFTLPGPVPGDLRTWPVEDPFGRPAPVYRRSRDDIEQRVMRLVLELRKRLP